MSDGQRLLTDKRQQILDIAHQYSAAKVRVFGSVARGEDRPDSDLDFLVSFAPGTSLLEHAGLELALQQLLGRTVEVASDRGLRPRYRERILREAVPL